MKRSSFAAGAFGAAFRSGRVRWRARDSAVSCSAAEPTIGACCFRPTIVNARLIERGLFCLALAFIAKNPLHIAILEWIFFIVASCYIGCAVLIGITEGD
jgi:hypothetical protein